MRPLIAVLMLSCACSAEDLAAWEASRPALVELSHTDKAQLREGMVIIHVTRALRNDGPPGVELTETIDLPEGGIVTSFQGAKGELLEATEADARWDALLSPGDAAPATSASLRWKEVNQVELKLFGLATGETITIDYDIQVPPQFIDGEWRVDQFRFPREPINKVEAKWALLRLAPNRTLWRLELDAAEIFEPAPVKPNVVFAIDASHSQGEAGIAAQLDLVAPYLAHAPDAQVEIVVYRRYAERLFHRFIPAADAIAAVRTLHLKPGNGSNLDRAAQAAADALKETTGPARVVLMTDEQLRDGFHPADAISAFRDTVVHVLARSFVDDRALELTRIENTPLADIAVGGIFARIDGDVRHLDTAPDALLHLVRPTHLDHFSVGDLDVPATLEPGDSLRYAAITDAPAGELTIRGQLWSVPYEQTVRADAALTRWLPGIAIGSRELEYQLEDDEVLALARGVRAVSRMTSYLASPPLAGASTIGQEAQRLALHGFGTRSSCGCGGAFSSGCSGVRVAGPAPDCVEALQALLVATANCGPGDVAIETTGDEIVDVISDDACLTEAAWALRLPPLFTRHDTYALSMRRTSAADASAGTGSTRTPD